MEWYKYRRLVVAHNPNSSRAALVEQYVFKRLRDAGIAYDAIEVQQASLEDNVSRLAPLIQKDDIILSAAGDGSAHALFHAVLAANQPGVEIGFLAFGNFNDLPHAFNTKATLQDPVMFLKNARPEEVWPLQVEKNGALLRNALLYSSVGWTANAAAEFDRPEVRHRITHGGAGLLRSLPRLGVYYLKSRNRSLLPSFRYNEKEYQKTDVIVSNGPTVARLFRSGKQYYLGESFLLTMLDVRSLIKNIPFLVSGFIGKMKGIETSTALLEFASPANLTLQCDGEVVELKDVNTLSIKKVRTPITVLRTKK